MNILILGSGSREHAFAWKIAQSPMATKIIAAPGNAGSARIATNIPIAATDFAGIKKIVLEEHIDLVVVGPEEPLVKGLADFFLDDPLLKGIPVIGPRKQAAQLEGSKDFAKRFMFKNNIPTANYRAFRRENISEAKGFLKTLKPPYVLKADGLAGGKGVLIVDAIEEAQRELEQMLINGKFGAAGEVVVVEEFLSGIELSYFVLTDGKSYKMLPCAKDYKRVGEGDKGLNTGGMGAVSPPPFAGDAFLKKVEDRIVRPTIQGLKNDNIPYVGFIFFGLMKVGEEPYVIEYNVRMGDPETQVVLPRITSDFLALLQAAANQRLDEISIDINPETAATVVAVSGGYPENYDNGKAITGLSKVGDGSIVFQGGVKIDENGALTTNGGRILSVTSYGKNPRQAVAKSLESLKQISFEGMYYRKDIGFDL